MYNSSVVQVRLDCTSKDTLQTASYPVSRVWQPVGGLQHTYSDKIPDNQYDSLADYFSSDTRPNACDILQAAYLTS